MVDARREMHRGFESGPTAAYVRTMWKVTRAIFSVGVKCNMCVVLILGERGQEVIGNTSQIIDMFLF